MTLESIEKSCITCEHALPIGEGDFICEECGYCFVANDYEFADMKCGGDKWEEA